MTHLLEGRNGRLVLLGELECSGDLGSIGYNLSIELSALLHEAFLTVMGLLQSSVQLLVLNAELLQALVTHQLRQHLQAWEGRGYGTYSVLVIS